MSKKWREKRKAKRAQFDLDPQTKEELRALSAETGIPQSQLVELFIAYGLEGLRSGKIDLAKYVEPSGSPQLWKYNLNIDKFKKDKDKK